MVVEEPHSCRENPRLMAAHELRESGLVTAVEAPYEVGVLDGFGIHCAKPIPRRVPPAGRFL
jgi:hypothetical protein